MRFRAFDFEAWLFVREDASFIVESWQCVASYLEGRGLLPEHCTFLGDGEVVLTGRLTAAGIECTTRHCPKLDATLLRTYRSLESPAAYARAIEGLAVAVLTPLVRS